MRKQRIGETPDGTIASGTDRIAHEQSEKNMPSDNDGSKYRGLIKHCTMYPATRNPLTKALQLIASHLGAGLTTESTVAVGYWKNNLYVAKLGRVGQPTQHIESLAALLEAPLDGEAEDTLSVFNDGGPTPISNIYGVGGGKTGLHAEMMLIKELGGASAWAANFYYGVTIAASQGACPGCAGFMNLKHIQHTGVRPNGRVSSRWFNPVDDTLCGSEVGLGLTFQDVNVLADCGWAKTW